MPTLPLILMLPGAGVAEIVPETLTQLRRPYKFIQ
jgi:hypothetical protein